MQTISVVIIGATGYTGQELLRLLRRHPNVTRITLASRQEAGQSVSALIRNTSLHVDPLYAHPDDPSLKNAQVIFFATPNGTALKAARAFINAGCKVIDLSADFRLKNSSTYTQWYGEAHLEPELLTSAVYGLVEINLEKIRKATLIANPGCYASAVQLGLIPLFRAGLIMPPFIADVKSGVSGAGKKLESDFLYHEVNENFRAYSVTGHRHHPEILQGLMSDRPTHEPPPELIFTPHLVPMQRGIMATLHVPKHPSCHEESVRLAYHSAYGHSAFIHILKAGNFPSTAEVTHTNMVSIGFHCRPEASIMTIIVALDNMVKGAAGQAIQNLNVMMGWQETLALI